MDIESMIRRVRTLLGYGCGRDEIRARFLVDGVSEEMFYLVFVAGSIAAKED